ncbi:MAG: response regulator transcription factor [Lachnospiraceae bacterium]|nr:response regulator transcription factor [Lachnospiraceae bacterium]
MRIRIAVVEDETDQYEYVKKLLLQWSEQSGESVTVTHVTCAEEYLISYNQPDTFDILFLDVYMKQMNGMELAKEIRNYDREVQMVFLTGVSDYVFDGYEIGAVRYLLKPILQDKLVETMSVCLEKIKQKSDDYISFKYQGEIIRLLRSDIYYVEVYGHYLRMVTKSETYEWKDSLQNMRGKLDTRRFVEANRSSIVNLEYVDKITREECMLENGTCIHVSKGAYKGLNEAFMTFYVG